VCVCVCRRPVYSLQGWWVVPPRDQAQLANRCNAPRACGARALVGDVREVARPVVRARIDHMHGGAGSNFEPAQQETAMQGAAWCGSKAVRAAGNSK